ncbi:hypothetical protein ACLQ3C_15700 [Gordonia sp. DT30]|uniref:hypothetical protein n=1 Tax=Gordonia sp. DT30 TaxID=3416546 RepID=UPI003CF65470
MNNQWAQGRRPGDWNADEDTSGEQPIDQRSAPDDRRNHLPMTEQTHPAARVLDATLTESVRQRLVDEGVRLVAVVDLDAAGAIVAAVDIVEDQVLLTAPSLGEVTPRELDRVIADHLVALGRVTPPAGDEWRDELRKLAGRGRTRLASSGGAFIMGEQHVRLFRMTHRDVEVATAPLAAALAEHLDATLAQVGVLDAPALLTSSHIAWPGLAVMLADARRTPVAVVDDSATDSSAADDSADGSASHGVTAPTSGDFPMPGSMSHQIVRMVEPSGVEPARVEPPRRAPSPAAPQPAPRVPPLSDASTETLAAVTEELAALPDEPAGPDEFATDADPAFGTNPAIDTELDRDAEPELDGEPAGDFDSNADRDEPAADRRWYSRPRWLLGGAVAGVLAVFGAAMAVAFTGGSSAPTPPAAVSTTTPSVSTSATPTSPPEYADPSDLVEARRPAVRYTPPPPPPPPAQTDSQTRGNSPRRGSPRPPRISIPVPGLPPIVIP